MKLKEQEEFAFEAVDMGNLYHGVLEIFAEKLKEIGKNWFDFTEEEGERLVDEAVDAYAVTYHHTVLFDSARNAYIVQRIKRILKRTVSAMQYQLKKGSFVPEKFEVSFSVLEELDAVNIALSEQEKMRLRGRIDRVDMKEDREHVFAGSAVLRTAAAACCIHECCDGNCRKKASGERNSPGGDAVLSGAGSDD